MPNIIIAHLGDMHRALGQGGFGLHDPFNAAAVLLCQHQGARGDGGGVDQGQMVHGGGAADNVGIRRARDGFAPNTVRADDGAIGEGHAHGRILGDGVQAQPQGIGGDGVIVIDKRHPGVELHGIVAGLHKAAVVGVQGDDQMFAGIGQGRPDRFDTPGGVTVHAGVGMGHYGKGHGLISKGVFGR